MWNDWKKQEKILIPVVFILFFLGFALITRWSPLAGDDWGYAYQARMNPVLEATVHQYLTWSGRVLAEFWGLTIASHKNVWNILNPLLFTGILFLLWYLSGSRKNPVISLLAGVLLILSVNNKLRMQTYTWIMGTTYVVPLFLFLAYLVLIQKEIKQGMQKWQAALSCLICLCLPLYMENAAGMLAAVNLLLVLYSFFIKKDKNKKWILFLAFSLAGLAVIGLSPGAHARMTGDNAAFNALPLYQKISTNWQSFLEWTFQNHAWMMMILCFVQILFLKDQKDCHFRGERIVLVLAAAAGAVLAFFPGAPSALMTIIDLLLILDYFDTASYLKSERKFFYLILLAAFTANGIMLISPIFDARSAIYTVYLFFLFILKMLGEVQWKGRKSAAVFSFISAVLCSFFAMNYYGLYSVVHQVTLRRNEQVEYYRLRPDTTDAYLLGYPDGSLHSADVIPGDTFHDSAFKAYNYLSSSMNLHFYYLDSYTTEAIWQENQ